MLSSSETLLDAFLPVFDVSDSVAVVVETDAGTSWDAPMDIDLVDVGRQKPLAGALGALRMLPALAEELLRGRRPTAAHGRMALREMTEMPAEEGGWLLLGERRPVEIALGLVGRFWRPVIDCAEIAPWQFRDFAEPNYAKTVYSLSVRSLEPHRSLRCGVMRTATTDERARRWFHRYWTLGVGSGAHLLVGGPLELTREEAERRASTVSMSDERIEEAAR
jgi:hypothetical protein